MPQISTLSAAKVFSNYLMLDTQSTQELSKHNLRTGRPYLTRLDRSNALKLIPHQAGKSGTKQSISFHEIILIAIGEYNDKDGNYNYHNDDNMTGSQNSDDNEMHIHHFCLQALTSNCRRLLHWRNAICHPSTNPSQISSKYLTFRQSDNHQMRICWMTKVT